MIEEQLDFFFDETDLNSDITFMSHENKFFDFYWKICERNINRTICKEKGFDKHHVYPISIFGKNSFKIKMSYEDHYSCHLSLWKGLSLKYGDNHFTTKKMKDALTVMRMPFTDANGYKWKVLNANDYKLKRLQLYKLDEMIQFNKNLKA